MRKQKWTAHFRPGPLLLFALICILGTIIGILVNSHITSRETKSPEQISTPF